MSGQTGRTAEYVGFSETKVESLCEKKQMDFGEVKAWYDGYELADGHTIYNPYSVMSACREKSCRSFWGKTSASEALTDFINMDFD